MMPRALPPLLLLVSLWFAQLLPGSCQQTPPTPLRPAQEALAAGLWEIAADHLQQALASPNLAAGDRSAVALMLAEAWLRDLQPARALALLEESFVASHPAQPFWKSQALAALGRFSEAADGFKALLARPEAPHRREAALTLANLRLSLDQADEALSTLQLLATSPDPAAALDAKLLQSRILLDLGRIAEARTMLPEPSTLSAEDRPTAEWIQAHLLLAEGRHRDAAALFQSLLDQPRGLSLSLFHSAAAGLARALIADHQEDAAGKFLLSFIQQHPSSPELPAYFEMLQFVLPEKPPASHPILEILAQWIPPAETTATGLLNLHETGATTPTASSLTPPTDRVAFALHTRAIGLYRTGSPQARLEAKSLLNRLRWEFPDHFLARRSLLLSARWSLESGNSPQAFALLDALRENALSPALKGQAAFIEAQYAFNQGNPSLAIQLFDEASNWLDADDARVAALNAAVLRLRATPSATTLVQAVHADDPQLAADLMLERALCLQVPAERRAALENFLSRHPEHPRTPEARLAAAEAALIGSSPDLSFARAQLETLASSSSPSSAAAPTSPRTASIRLRIADLEGNPDAAISMAREILDQFSGQPVADEAALVLGRKLFESRNYNEARMALEKLAAATPSPDRAQAAWLLAARSASLVPTTQSRQEALILFDKVIDFNLSLATLAKLEKARLMIDMNRLADAESFLGKWFSSLQPSDPHHLPCGLLLGEAIYAQGSAKPDSLTAALAVYDLLLARSPAPSADFNRIQYLRGRTLEQLADPADPSKTREKQAFAAYYSVLETTPPPAEWHYFELCGFRALAMLEKSARWQAAIACAKKIASFQGPRAKDAADRSSQIQLEQMIWED